jgi:predicted glycoside hydrolase/deacetylase ChbG (UPF0249 family)
MKVILNADDFGSTERHTRLILSLLEKGKISSTTFLVNLPYSREAATILRTKYPTQLSKVGLHFNLIEGQPLNPALVDSPFVGTDKNLRDFRGRISIFRQFLHLRKLICELNLQVQQFHTLVGKYPTHIDSHGHTHCTLIILVALLVSKQAGKVRAIRLSRQFHHEPQYRKGLKNRVRRMAKGFLNAAFRLRFRTVDYFTDIRNMDGNFIRKEDLLYLQGKFQVVEIMCHPYYFDESEYDFLQTHPNLFEQVDGLEFAGYVDI